MEIKVNSELKYLVDSIDGKESIPDEEVYIQDNQPEDGKIWIDTGELSNLGTEVVDSVNGTQTNKAPSVRAVVQDLVSILYPIGSIYMSTNATNPKDLFGIGEWEQIKDTFLMSAGTTYGAGTTGGTASHTHSIGHTHGIPGVAHTHTTGNHTLTVAEMPSHSHTVKFDQLWSLSGGTTSLATAPGGPYGGSGYVYNTGGDGAHNHGNTGSTTPTATTTNSQSTSTSGSTSNLPPYLAVFTWKRVS